LKKILTITDKAPKSSSKPGNPRFFEFSKYLSEEVELDLILISHEEIGEEKQVYKNLNIVTPKFKLESKIGKIYRYLTFLPSFYKGLGNFKEVKRIKNIIHKQFNENKYDLIYVDGLIAYQYVPKKLLKYVFLDLCDAISKLKYREAKSNNNFLKKILLFQESISIYFQEILAIRDVFKISFISKDEANTFDVLFNIKRYRSKLVILNQGIEKELFSYTKLSDLSKKILFFGALDYTPNSDAAIWFIKEILPLVCREFPFLEFHIAGRNPSKELISLIDNKTSFIHADVPEMFPFIESSRIVLVPLRIGAGVKNKILVAALCGRPIISTSIGLEGLEDFLKTSIYKADTPSEFTEKISLILSKDIYRLNNSLEETSRLVEDSYSWKNSALKILNSSQIK
jgi:hypothetical protein